MSNLETEKVKDNQKNCGETFRWKLRQRFLEAITKSEKKVKG